MKETEPNETLYIRNLVETRACNALKESLKMIFSQYGEVLDIRVKRNISLRGQAFVVYKNKESAANAMKEIQGFPLFSKPMDIQYAREKSYIITEMQTGKDALNAQKRKRCDEKDKVREAKRSKGETGKGQNRATQKVISLPDELLPPNKILFIQNLPPGDNEARLTELFGQFAGFKEVRLVPGKGSIAFIEYEDESLASLAKISLDKYILAPECAIGVTFAKK